MSDPLPGNLAELVRRAAHRAPGRPALRYRAQQLTWSDLDAGVDGAAAGLLGLGLAPGDRVALAMGNLPEFVVGYFGALRAGLVVVPANPALTVPELRHVLADSGARAVACARGSAATVQEAAAGSAVEHVVVVDVTDPPAGTLAFDALLAGASLPPASAAAAEPAPDPERLAALLYTSGTSGRPKGAMLTHRALLANLEQCAAIEPPVGASDDVVLLVLPLFHVYGLAALGLVAWYAATGLLVERFDPVDTLRLVREHHVTNVAGAPPMYLAWSMLPDLAESFDGVRLAVSGAAPLPPAVFRTILDSTGRPVFEGYGLTETAPALTTTLVSPHAKPGSIGRPIPGVDVRLIDESGSETADGDPGEIVVRGRNLFSGYWPDGRDGPDADGWFATGDIALADEDGDLFLVDRRKELVLVSGFNVYPREVEVALETHADIAEVAVVGIEHPYTGETVKAFVVLRDGSRLTAHDVMEFATTRLARFKCPTVVEFVDQLPHTATGKVAKGRLRVEGAR